MADFYEVWLSRAAVLVKLDAMLEAREAAREQELKAATDIKRVYRGKVCAFLCPAWSTIVSLHRILQTKSTPSISDQFVHRLIFTIGLRLESPPCFYPALQL